MNVSRSRRYIFGFLRGCFSSPSAFSSICDAQPSFDDQFSISVTKFRQSTVIQRSNHWICESDMTEEITNDNWHRRHNTMRCADKNVINNKISSFSHSTLELKIFLPPVITCNNFSLFSHFPAFTTHHLWWWQIPALYSASKKQQQQRLYHCASITSEQKRRKFIIARRNPIHKNTFRWKFVDIEEEEDDSGWPVCAMANSEARKSKSKGNFLLFMEQQVKSRKICRRVLHTASTNTRAAVGWKKWASNTREVLVLV